MWRPCQKLVTNQECVRDGINNLSPPALALVLHKGKKSLYLLSLICFLKKRKTDAPRILQVPSRLKHSGQNKADSVEERNPVTLITLECQKKNPFWFMENALLAENANRKKI